MFAELSGVVGLPVFGITFLGRLPLAMVLIAVLAQTSVDRGSLAEAGAASAPRTNGGAKVPPSLRPRPLRRFAASNAA